jgi:hypothetical protein
MSPVDRVLIHRFIVVHTAGNAFVYQHGHQPEPPASYHSIQTAGHILLLMDGITLELNHAHPSQFSLLTCHPITVPSPKHMLLLASYLSIHCGPPCFDSITRELRGSGSANRACTKRTALGLCRCPRLAVGLIIMSCPLIQVDRLDLAHGTVVLAHKVAGFYDEPCKWPGVNVPVATGMYLATCTYGLVRSRGDVQQVGG